MAIEGEDPKDIGEHVEQAVEHLVGDEPAGEGLNEVQDELSDVVNDNAELDLDDDDRLPWLESADDDYDDEGVDTSRIFGFVLAGLLVLALLVGAIWWFSHRKPDPSLVPDGSTIAAPSEAYKEKPKNPGGKALEGTGNTSYSVSQGKDGEAKLAGGGEAPKPSVDTGGVPAGNPAPAAAVPTGGVGIQVGAYSSQAAAEAGWNKLVGQSPALKGVKHRVIEGNADIGKVYRLQAVAGDGAAADALCGQLKAAHIGCQVKR